MAVLQHAQIQGDNLTEDAEQALILAAQDGDDDAKNALISAYWPMVQRYLKRHAERPIETEDLEQEARLGILLAIRDYDPAKSKSKRLAGLVHRTISQALGGMDDPCIVPYRTRRRYAMILRKAGGDVELAASIAPEHSMSADSFHVVHDAMSIAFVSYPDNDEDHELDSPALSSAETRELAEEALSTITGDELTVTRYYHGFTTGEPLSDAAIVQEWSLQELGPIRVANGESVTSRSAVQRARKNALVSMQTALGVVSPDETVRAT